MRCPLRFSTGRFMSSCLLLPAEASRVWTGEDGLGHVVYFVEDYEEAKRFYTSTMGFKISDRIVWDGGEKDATFFTVTPGTTRWQ